MDLEKEQTESQKPKNNETDCSNNILSRRPVNSSHMIHWTQFPKVVKFWDNFRVLHNGDNEYTVTI